MPWSTRTLLFIAAAIAFVPVIVTVGASETCSGEDEQYSIEWASTSMYFWHPGETKVEDFYVKNRGGLEDSYWLSIEYDVPSWSCSLDRDNLWNVSPGETEIFNVSITAPLIANAGDYVNITLTAGSMTVNISESLSWRAFVIVERSINLRYEGDSPVILTDDMEVMWELVVENTGDVWSEVQLTSWSYNVTWWPLYEQVSIDNWLTVTIEPTTMTLDPGERAWVNVTLKVHTPSALSSKAEYRTDVRAQDTAERGVWDGKVIRWSIPYRYSVSFSPEEGSFPAVPGIDGTLSVNVDQVTNDWGDYQWNLHLDNQKLGWVVRPTARSMILNGTAVGSFDIVITSPVTAPPGERLELRVILTCSQRPEDVLDIRYVFEVITVRLLTIHVTPDEIDMDHSTSPTFSIVLSNHGNVWQGVEFGARFGNGTNISFTDCARRGVGIPPLNRTEFIMTLALGMYLRPGANIVEFWAEGEDLGEVTFGVVVNVPERVELTVSHSYLDEIALDPNAPDEVVSLSLANTGNVQIGLAMEYLVSPVRSGITLHPVGIKKDDIILLDPGEKRLVDVVVNVSANFNEAAYVKSGTIRFAASYWGGDKVWAKTFTFNMVGPDLTIDRVDWDYVMREGEDSVAHVIVGNVGTSAAPMSFLVMSGGIDPDGPVVVPVPPLLVGESVTMEVNFLPRDGTNTYTFLLDPDDALIELGVAPNELTVRKTTTMDRAGDSTEEGRTVLTWIALAALAVIATFSLWFLRLRPRKG